MPSSQSTYPVDAGGIGPARRRRHAQLGAEVEEIVLDPSQPVGVAGRLVGQRKGEAELRAELIDLSPASIAGSSFATGLVSPLRVSPPSPFLV